MLKAMLRTERHGSSTAFAHQQKRPGRAGAFLLVGFIGFEPVTFCVSNAVGTSKPHPTRAFYATNSLSAKNPVERCTVSTQVTFC